jgi:nitrile hydratase accessory protein
MASIAVQPTLDGAVAPPMVNGEVTFAAPWQGRAFGMAHELAATGVIDWDDFRAHLIAQIAAWESAHPDGVGFPYYDCFLAALETVIVERHIVTADGLARRTAALVARPHDHDHDHDHRHQHREHQDRETHD